MNQAVAGKTVLRRKGSDTANAVYKSDSTASEVDNEARVQRAMLRKQLNSKAEKISGSKECVLRWPYKDASKIFPNEPMLRFVDKYYQWADGGPLLIDEPKSKEDMARCMRKEPHLRAMGYRYLILTPEMDEYAGRAELEKTCGQPQPKQ